MTVPPVVQQYIPQRQPVPARLADCLADAKTTCWGPTQPAAGLRKSSKHPDSGCHSLNPTPEYPADCQHGLLKSSKHPSRQHRGLQRATSPPPQYVHHTPLTPWSAPPAAPPPCLASCNACVNWRLRPLHKPTKSRNALSVTGRLSQGIKHGVVVGVGVQWAGFCAVTHQPLAPRL